MKPTMNFERYLTQQDAAILSRLAESLLRELDVKLNHGEQLVELLTSAILIPEQAKREDCVALYSEVLYQRLDTNELHTATIVCPYEAAPTLARFSALAPLSLALIGRQVDSLVPVILSDNQSYMVRIVAVNNMRMSSSSPEGINGGQQKDRVVLGAEQLG